jgi:3-deoxy-D-manno-octulosonic-acid transferase
MYLIYSALMAAGLLLSLPYWMLTRRHGRWREGLGERLGRVPARRRRAKRPYVSAASVGEVLAVSELVKKLRERFPKYRVVVSTTTATGQKLARKHFGDDSVFYFPLDLASAIRAYLSALRPQLIVLAETEFWPNVLRMAHASSARVVVVNARISDRSWPGYRRFRPVLRKILQDVDLFLAQTEEDATRLRDIGAPVERVQVSGNVKFDVALPPAPAIVANLRSNFQQTGAGPIIVCGSTMEGEERLLLLAFQNVLDNHHMTVMILATRRPEHFNEVEELMQTLRILY